MTSKSVMSLAFTAGCVLALGAMPSAHAQYNPPQPVPAPAELQPQAYAPPPQPYAGPPPQTQAMPTQMVTNGPQPSRGDWGDWSARRNVIESAQYDRLLETSPGFRQARMRKECGPIGDPQLHQQCLASFQQYEPVMYGSSMPPHWRHQRGAGY